MRLSRTVPAALALALLSTSFSVPPARAADAGPIKIALITDMSGVYAALAGPGAARPGGQRHQTDVLVEGHHVGAPMRQVGHNVLTDHALDLGPERGVGDDVAQIFRRCHGRCCRRRCGGGSR